MLLRGKRLKAILALTTFVVSVGVWAAVPALAVNINESEASQKELKQKNEELKQELQKSKDSIREEGDRKDQLDKQISIVKQQIDNSNKYILKLEIEIEELEGRIESLNQDMEKKKEVLKESLYSIYIAGDASGIDIILQAKTFEDFLDKAEIVRSVSDTISGLIDQLNADIKQIEDNKRAIEEKKKEAELERVDLTNNRNELQDLLDESEEILSQLQTSEQRVKDQIDENDEELKKINAEIEHYYEEQRIIAEREKRRQEEEKKRQEAQKNNQTSTENKDNSGTGQSSANKDQGLSVGTGTLMWPVPGFYYISSDYYDTVNRNSMHGAIDIAGSGIYGAKVVAADDGEVIFANASGYGGGYGIYVIIDHGNGKSTLYAHMSSLAVQKGQTVKKGQTIGYVGSTGLSTGPHLHFETRLYGKKYNPMDELKR